MLESAVKSDIVRAIRKEGGYARRIEDKFTVGMPDLILIPLQCPVIFAEAKVVRDNMFGPTARQFIELTKTQIPPHATSLLIGWKDEIHAIAWPHESVDFRECFQQYPNEPIGNCIRRFLQQEGVFDDVDGREQRQRSQSA